MPRKQKKYHFIYKTTNLINDKFYVGMHSTDDFEDGYVGSGKRLGYSVRKYGLENHKFEILEFLSSREELKKRESEVVNEELLADPLCMNLKFGGEGGWDHLNGLSRSSEQQSKIAKEAWKTKKNNPAFMEQYRKDRAAQVKDSHSAGKIPYGRSFLGKSLTPEHKAKIAKKSSDHQTGEGNSQFGTCWICNSKEVKKIKAIDVEYWLFLGWQKGRKFTNSLV